MGFGWVQVPSMVLAGFKSQSVVKGFRTHQKKISMSKDKEKAAARWQEGHNMIKSNPVTAGWVIHKLENKNTKEVVPLL